MGITSGNTDCPRHGGSNSQQGSKKPILPFENGEASERKPNKQALCVNLDKKKARGENDQVKDRAESTVLTKTITRQIVERQHTT